MPRKGENIFKRKDGRWEGRYIKKHENGKAIYLRVRFWENLRRGEEEKIRRSLKTAQGRT